MNSYELTDTQLQELKEHKDALFHKCVELNIPAMFLATVKLEDSSKTEELELSAFMCGRTEENVTTPQAPTIMRVVLTILENDRAMDIVREALESRTTEWVNH